jgi:hypothetical protein
MNPPKGLWVKFLDQPRKSGRSKFWWEYMAVASKSQLETGGVGQKMEKDLIFGNGHFGKEVTILAPFFAERS